MLKSDSGKAAHAVGSRARSHPVDSEGMRMGKGDYKNRHQQVEATLFRGLVVKGKCMEGCRVEGFLEGMEGPAQCLALKRHSSRY